VISGRPTDVELELEANHKTDVTDHFLSRASTGRNRNNPSHHCDDKPTTDVKPTTAKEQPMVQSNSPIYLSISQVAP
jgi:hypothetical protein